MQGNSVVVDSLSPGSYRNIMKGEIKHDSKPDRKVHSLGKALFRACIGFWQQLEARVHKGTTKAQQRTYKDAKGDGIA